MQYNILFNVFICEAICEIKLSHTHNNVINYFHKSTDAHPFEQITTIVLHEIWRSDM